MPARSQPSPIGSSFQARRVTDIISDLQDGEAYYTFEYFPPKTEQGLANLNARIGRMASGLRPSCIHITWGAGGSTSERSLELARTVQEEFGVAACLHLTCTNMEQETLENALQKAKEFGIVNLLALRGDPPRGEEYWIPSCTEFQHAADLVRHIRRRYGSQFCIGVAGYPEGAPDSEDRSKDTHYLKEKVDAGADFVVTQLFYDTDRFIGWVGECRAVGITQPIVPGIMPVQNYASFRRLTKLCKAVVPEDVASALEPLASDDAAVKAYGIELSVSMIRRLLDSGVRGFHLCTLNLEVSVRSIVQSLAWVKAPAENLKQQGQVAEAEGAKLFVPSGPQVEADPSLKAIAQSPDGVWSNLQADVGTKAWDEFPNGRFGDARSPAYGNLDGYGASLKVPAPEALRLWGSPTSEADITAILSSYIRGEIPAIPWCEEPLRPETSLLLPRLLQLNQRGWWTVGSQPAVDGVPSTDPAAGFGPPGGRVYQKAFVEFFATQLDLDRLEAKISDDTRARGGVRMVRYFAGNRAGEHRTNMSKQDRSVVTWGVFKGREVVSPTLIEEMSFTAWKEEAFEIWDEWQLLYPLKSPARQFIEEVAASRWLVSVVHNDYKDEGALWEFLAT